jgi:phosphoglucomutase
MTVTILGTEGVLYPAISEVIRNAARMHTGTDFKNNLFQPGLVIASSHNPQL